MPDQDQVLPIYFPVNGIDLSTEFELQLAQTTPVGFNVRGYEPSTSREFVVSTGITPVLGDVIGATLTVQDAVNGLNAAPVIATPVTIPGSGSSVC